MFLNSQKNSSFLNKALNESTVEVLIGNELSRISNKSTWLHGVFQIKDDDLNHLEKLHKALVITWTSSGVSRTKNLIGNTILFSDDEKIYNNFRVGYFSYDLSDWLNFHDLQQYYITVSLHKYISNTIYLEV